MSTSKRQTASTKRASSKRATTKRATGKWASSKRAASRRSTTAAADEFVCPECGRTFSRAAALGAHRSRAHGVAGKSARATSRRTSSSPSARTTGGAGAGTRAPSNTRRGAGASRDGIDRDALLKSVFPNGLPAREDVIRAATNWLDDAEELVRML
jgi:hypothetical protein